jgi:hypothetical protein
VQLPGGRLAARRPPDSTKKYLYSHDPRVTKHIQNMSRHGMGWCWVKLHDLSRGAHGGVKPSLEGKMLLSYIIVTWPPYLCCQPRRHGRPPLAIYMSHSLVPQYKTFKQNKIACRTLYIVGRSEYIGKESRGTCRYEHYMHLRILNALFTHVSFSISLVKSSINGK